MLKLVKYVIVALINLLAAGLAYFGALEGKEATAIFIGTLGYLFGVAHNASIPGVPNGQRTSSAPPPTLLPPGR
jgi:hypothetical protein